MNLKIYSAIAEIYPHMMAHVNYKMWAHYIYDIAREFEADITKSLEIAAGEGKLAAFLQRIDPDFNIIETDLSKQLLKKVPENWKRVVCDMRALPFTNEFTFIFCLFDSMNYLLNEKDFLKTLNEVKNILSPKGIFTFDVSLESNSYRCVNDLNREARYKGVKYTQESIYEPETRIHKNIITLSMQDGRVFREEHLQRIYPEDFYYRIIDDAGLKIYDVFDSFSFDPVTEETERIQFIVGK